MAGLNLTVVSATSVGVPAFGQPAQLAQKGGGGYLRIRTVSASGSNDYPVGGYPITASQVLMSTQLIGWDEIASFGSVTLTSKFDATNNTIRLYTGAGAELATSSTSNWVVRVQVWGW